MSSENQMIIQETKSMSVQEELTIDDLVRMLHKVQSVMTKVMVINEDYGKLPGTSKPSLLLPGAQKLNMMFRFSPVYDWKEEKLEANHRNYLVSCDLIHIITGKLVARGLGSCSTLESKYRYRTGGIVCPDCGNDSISKGKGDESWNKNFYCNTKKGGCNAKFPLTDERLVSQPVGKTENKDIADCWNTVLKMACKRALIAATINATGASCIFTQDVEESSNFPELHKEIKARKEVVEVKQSIEKKSLTQEEKQQVRDAIELAITIEDLKVIFEDSQRICREHREGDFLKEVTLLKNKKKNKILDDELKIIESKNTEFFDNEDLS